MKDFKKFFASLPPENTREFEIRTTDFAGKYCEPSDISMIQKSIQSKNEKVAYAAFYTLCVIYRRSKSFLLLNQLLDQCYERFSKHVSYDHLKILYLIESDSIYNYDDILERSYSNSLAMEQNAGYIHAFSDVFASICEKCEQTEKEYYIEKWYQKALEAVNKAIELDPNYAKYYCTKARIIVLKKNYNEALKLIKNAISIEDFSRKDYALRISTYQFYNMYIVLQQNMYELERKLSGNSAKPELKKSKSTHETNNINIPFDENSPYAFVSYSHTDSPIVKDIIEQLSAKNFNIWYDKGLIPGEEFWEVLASRITNCNCVLLFLSGNSVDSGAVRREINFALEEKKNIISIFLDDVSLSPGMRIQLNLLQNVSIKGSESNEKFINSISSALTKQGL